MFQGRHFCDSISVEGYGKCLYETVVAAIGTIICQGIGIIIDLDEGVVLCKTSIMLNFIHLGDGRAVGGDGKGADITIPTMTGICQRIGFCIHFDK